MENLTVKVVNENGEIIIREGQAQNILPELAPLKIDISGVLDAPLKWIEKRSIVQDEANIIFNRINRTIVLNTHEKNGYHLEKIKGTLKLHDDIELWRINDGFMFENFKLADLIKMNRGYFSDKNVAMSLVSELKNFRVKVSKELEKADDNRGDKTQLRKQTIIENNLPEKFKINIGIFKGYAPKEIEVEVYVDADTFNCSLISPDLNAIMKNITDNAINENIELIKGLCPDLVIIEE